MSDWGIKVMNAGADITSTDVRDQIMNSQYSMFKYHSDGTVAISMGTATVKYGTINHNLGYVPAHLVYIDYPNDALQRIVPSIPYGVGFDWYPTESAGTANIVVGFNRAPFDGTVIGTTDNSGINEELWTGSAGLIAGNAGGGKRSAVRFPSVAIGNSETITSATLEIMHVFSGTTTTDTKFKVYGIDEDNVGGDFSWDSTKTTAFDARTQARVNDFWNFATDVKDQVEEIIARPGWVSGNAMGFIFDDDGSDSNAYIGDDTNTTAQLTIVKPGSLSDVTVTFRVIVFKDKIV